MYQHPSDWHNNTGVIRQAEEQGIGEILMRSLTMGFCVSTEQQSRFAGPEDRDAVQNGAMPGLIEGSMISHHTRRREQPSIRAARSMSHETLSKNPFISQMPSGSDRATITVATPPTVL